jgi:hypothetical protein
MTAAFIIGYMELIWLIAIINVIIPVIALISILRSKFEENNKLIWIIVVVFLNLIGAILYYFIGRKQRINTL